MLRLNHKRNNIIAQFRYRLFSTNTQNHINKSNNSNVSSNNIKTNNIHIYLHYLTKTVKNIAKHMKTQQTIKLIQNILKLEFNLLIPFLKEESIALLHPRSNIVNT